MAPPRTILGTEVRARFPARGPVDVVLVGEAPGPRGADRSGVPFWGDRSGRLVYRALVEAGRAEVPEEAFDHWDGAELVRRGLRPRLLRTALTNALSRCPTRDGLRFCAPSRAELRHPANERRLLGELRRAARRADGPLIVIALGRHAEQVLEALRARAPGLVLRQVPHPSAQALASGRPGAKMRDLEAEWCRRLVGMLPPVRSHRRDHAAPARASGRRRPRRAPA